nr:MAG TPA: hypothetical protein [Caudoviricetes sp.]
MFYIMCVQIYFVFTTYPNFLSKIIFRQDFS